MRRLTILLVAYPLAPAGPDAVGGAEQILTHLDRALTRAGHRSIVVAAEGSQTYGRLVPTPAPTPGTVIDDELKGWIQAEHARNIVRVLEREPVDVVHLHGIDFDAYLPPPGVPALATLHLPPAWYDGRVWDGTLRPDTWLHCVSASQRRACPPDAQNLLPVIENGVPVEELARARHARRRFAVTLGRICPEKNFHVALEAGTKAGMPVLLGGQVFPYETHQRYWHEQVIPRLSPPHRYLGPVGFARKRRLLASASCLLSASVAPETSSLVAMEAMACGTPVIALPSGALSDIVEHGRTGFLVRDADEMAEAIRSVDRIDRDVCRETARRRFSVERMAAEYLAVYERLARGVPAAYPPPSPLPRREGEPDRFISPSPSRGAGYPQGGWGGEG